MRINNSISSKIILVLLVIIYIPAILDIEFINTEQVFAELMKPLKFPNYVPNPYPDEISFIPYKKVTNQVEYSYQTQVVTSENSYSTIIHDDEKKKDSLIIRKRNGKFYWDSNGKKELMTITGFFAPMKENGREIKKGKYTIFTALDGSGTIIIKHDIINSSGSCGYRRKISDYASYKEVKVNQGTILYGGGYRQLFPVKPDDWCYGSAKHDWIPSNILEFSIIGNIIAITSFLAQLTAAILILTTIIKIKNRGFLSRKEAVEKIFSRALIMAFLIFVIPYYSGQYKNYRITEHLKSEYASR